MIILTTKAISTSSAGQRILKVWVGALATTATVLCASGAAHATDYTWVGGNGSWNTPGKWSPMGVPDGDDTAFIGGKVSVTVTSDVTVRNLRLGKDARLSNSARVTVPGWTSSDGLVTGVGSVNIPGGAAATFNLGGSVMAHSGVRRLRGGLCQVAPIEFGKIENNGRLQVNISASVDVAFSDITNRSGTTVLNAGGLSVASSGRGNRWRKPLCQTTSPIRLKTLKNEAGSVTMRGTGATGRAFQGEGIENKAEFIFDHVRALTKNDYKNDNGATMTFKGSSLLACIVGEEKKIENNGLVHLLDGDSEVRMEWVNKSKVVIENGTLLLAPPKDKECKQDEGSTTLEGGTLEIVDHEDTSDDKRGLILKGGTLNGSGTINADVRNDGATVKVGHSPGLITINGNYTQTANGIMDMEIWGLMPGTQYDQLRVSGNVYLAGTMNIVMGNNFIPGSGNSFKHISYIGRIGSFSRINIVNPVPGRTYRTNYTTSGLMSTTLLTSSLYDRSAITY